MAKAVTIYVCNECEAQSPVAMGRCPRCSTWNSMEAQTDGAKGSNKFSAKSMSKKIKRSAVNIEVQSLASVDELDLMRTSSGIGEVDRVIGGGWVPGGVFLLAGEPGIGKSTLLLQLAANSIAINEETLYVAGEESLGQVKMRAQRLGLGDELMLTREIDSRELAAHIIEKQPAFVIVDSIQSLVADDDGTPGSLSQVRDSTAILNQAAKEAGSSLVLIGHITKQGSIAGPKVVEHMVDATLVLESASGFRVLRSVKNRFGAAGEMGVFEMTSEGMRAVDNPSEAFLAERPKGVPGSIVCAALEGQRPLLLEVQALAAKSPYPSPKRVVQGLDYKRVDVVLAVLERRLELPLAGLDIYVNVAGGLRLTDPGTDLAVGLAVYSAVTNQTVPEETAVVGEVGLAGELRSVTQLERRALECEKSGYTNFVAPKGFDAKRSSNLNAHSVKSVAAAIRAVWGN